MDMKTILANAGLKKKISVKTVCGGVDPMKDFGTITDGKPEKASIDMMRVIGQAHKIKTGNSDFGPWISFKGDFIGINLVDQTAFRGTNLFLPDVAAEVIENAIILGDGGVVNIALDITAEFDPESSVLYVYGAKPLIEPTESDPMLTLLGSLENQLPALPEIAAKTGSDPATAKKK